MALESRLRELDARHRDLDGRIESALRHPSADTLEILELKRQKLKIKEQIEEIRGRLRH
ncbi:MAG: DUF465 domain-containing protein [Hyphomonadaceae bacterium]|nr:DUF465 domain-containing protein [Hyphomonadaceae bacterium]